MANPKKPACKKKMRKCCTRKQIELLGKNRVKKCCCMPGAANAGKGSQTRGTRGTRNGDGVRRGGEDQWGRRTTDNERGGRQDISMRDIGSALMGGISTSVGGSVTGAIR